MNFHHLGWGEKVNPLIFPIPDDHNRNASSNSHNRLVKSRGQDGRLLHTLPHTSLQMPPERDRKVVFPLHIRVCGAGIGEIETTEEVSGDEIEFRIGEIDADTRSRAFRKRHESAFQFFLIGGCDVEPALWAEGLRICEGV